MVNDYKKYFIFNGKKSSDFDVWASGLNIFHSPERRIERIQVPGRNGELLIEDGSFENTELLFKDCFIPRHFSENFTNLSNYLNRQKGYQRLELSWLPDEYRLAAFHGDIEASMKNWDGMGKFDLTFNCKPQRFLKSGEEPIYIIPLVNGVKTTQLVSFQQYGTVIKLIKIPASGSVTFKINYLDSATQEVVSVTLGTVTEVGWTYVFEQDFPAFDWWQIEAVLGQNDNPDDLQFELNANYAWGNLDGEYERVTAICGRSFDIENPTNFECRPIIEVNGAIFGIQNISNYDVDGNEVESWNINCDDYSSVTTAAVIDCENEYFYYVDGGKKKNITGYMTIDHYDAHGDAILPSFPKMASGKTNIYSYLTYSAYEDVFIRLYPRWYTI